MDSGRSALSNSLRRVLGNVDNDSSLTAAINDVETSLLKLKKSTTIPKNTRNLRLQDPYYTTDYSKFGRPDERHASSGALSIKSDEDLKPLILHRIDDGEIIE